MGKFHIIPYLQKYGNNSPIIESILSSIYMICLVLGFVLNYYYWAQVYCLNFGRHNLIPLAQVSGVPSLLKRWKMGTSYRHSDRAVTLEPNLPLH